LFVKPAQLLRQVRPQSRTLIGTYWRELLDHVIVLNAQHLRQLLREVLGCDASSTAPPGSQRATGSQPGDHRQHADQQAAEPVRDGQLPAPVLEQSYGFIGLGRERCIGADEPDRQSQALDRREHVPLDAMIRPRMKLPLTLMTNVPYGNVVPKHAAIQPPSR
jgi:hypothetical protein